MSGKSSQAKGRRAEIELSKILQSYGYPVEAGRARRRDSVHDHRSCGGVASIPGVMGAANGGRTVCSSVLSWNPAVKSANFNASPLSYRTAGGTIQRTNTRGNGRTRTADHRTDSSAVTGPANPDPIGPDASPGPNQGPGTHARPHQSTHGASTDARSRCDGSTDTKHASADTGGQCRNHTERRRYIHTRFFGWACIRDCQFG